MLSPPAIEVDDKVRVIDRGLGYPEHHASLEIQFLRLDRRNRLLHARVTLGIFPESLLSIVFRDDTSDTPAARSESGETFQLSPWTTDRKQLFRLVLNDGPVDPGPIVPFRAVDAWVRSSGAEGLYPNGSPIPADPTGAWGIQRNVVLRLDGSQRTFPGDWYRLHVSPQIYPPNNVITVTESLDCYGVPVDALYELGPALNDMKVTAFASPNVACASPGSVWGLDLLLTTDDVIKAYSYALVTVPLVLLVLGVLMFATFHRDRTEMVRGTLFSLAAGLFAVLPVRAVTVPDDVPGITRLDILLGCSVLASLAVVLATLALIVARGEPSKTKSEAGQTG